jgi:predicted DNA-binding ribbon-helix-helix protein
LEKRSVSLAGHRTSLALEPEFWSALEQMAIERELPLAALIRQIDERRAGSNLSSAVRVEILRWAQQR